MRFSNVRVLREPSSRPSSLSLSGLSGGMAFILISQWCISDTVLVLSASSSRHAMKINKYVRAVGGIPNSSGVSGTGTSKGINFPCDKKIASSSRFVGFRNLTKSDSQNSFSLSPTCSISDSTKDLTVCEESELKAAYPIDFLRSPALQPRQNSPSALNAQSGCPLATSVHLPAQIAV